MIFVVNADGQLCNRLLLLAHAYATGLETNQITVHVVAKDIQKDIRLFGKSLKILNLNTKKLYDLCNKVMNSLFKIRYSDRNNLNKIELKQKKFHQKGIHILDNWYYRDYDSLFKHRDEVISAFRPQAEYEVKVEAFISDIKERFNEYKIVGVHIRRGDYKYWRCGKYYYSNDTYDRWMSELVKSSNQKLIFILFSNEKISTKDFKNCSALIMNGPNHPIEDVYAMAKCDYIFGPPSTYSWWAAFYGGKKYLTMYSEKQSISEQDFTFVKGEEFNPPS